MHLCIITFSLGRSWTYAMSAIALVIFSVVVFPHEGKLVTVDQLSFTQKGRMETNESTIPLVDQVRPTSESLGDGMYASMMGTFDIPALINYIGSTSVGKSIAPRLLIGLILGFSLRPMNRKCPYQ